MPQPLVIVRPRDLGWQRLASHTVQGGQPCGYCGHPIWRHYAKILRGVLYARTIVSCGGCRKEGLGGDCISWRFDYSEEEDYA